MCWNWSIVENGNRTIYGIEFEFYWRNLKNAEKWDVSKTKGVRKFRMEIHFSLINRSRFKRFTRSILKIHLIAFYQNNGKGKIIIWITVFLKEMTKQNSKNWSMTWFNAFYSYVIGIHWYATLINKFHPKCYMDIINWRNIKTNKQTKSLFQISQLAEKQLMLFLCHFFSYLCTLNTVGKYWTMKNNWLMLSIAKSHTTALYTFNVFYYE